MATISPANSTITDTVSLLLLDTSKGSNITPGVTNNFITYISSSTVPGRIATVRDATGYVSTGNIILLSTTKNVFFADGSSTLSITQPFGFVSFSSRNTNQWSILNTFAFPDPLGTSYVSNVNVMNTINTSNLNVNSISSGSLTINSIRGSSISTNSISTNNIRANSVSTNSISTNSIRANIFNINSISSIYISTNSLIASNLTTTNIITNNIYSEGNFEPIYIQCPTLQIEADINMLGAGRNIIDVNILSNVNLLNLIDGPGSYPGGLSLFVADENINGHPILGYFYGLTGRTIAQDWSYLPAESNINMVNYSISNNNILYTKTIQSSNISSINISTNSLIASNLTTSNIYTNNIYSDGDLISINYDSVFLGNMDLNNNNIEGVNSITISNITCSNTITAPTMFTNQTTTITSNVATNYVIPLHNYFQETDTFYIVKDTLPFQQLIRPVTTSLRFNSQAGFRRYNVSFQFSGETNSGNTSNIYYYCSLYNANTTDIVNGNTINETFPLTYVQNDLNPDKFSFSYSDVFDIGSVSWATNNAICPYLYAKTTSDVAYKFVNYKMNLTMTPIVLTTI